MRLFRLFLTFAVASLALACQEPEREPTPEQTKAVTYYTIEGAWELAELDDEPLMEGTALYIEFDRKERRFVMWDNFDSMYFTKTSGNFTISEDEYKRCILSGWYDFGVGDWAQDYIVEMTILGDYMQWRGMSQSEKMLFRRIEQLPTDFNY